MVPRTFLFIFHTGSHNFLNSNYKEKTAGSACVPDCLSVSMTMLQYKATVAIYIHREMYFPFPQEIRSPMSNLHSQFLEFIYKYDF